MHRFFVDGPVLSRSQARQVATVLRLVPGDLVVLVRDGEEMDYRLDLVSATAVEGTVIARRPATGEPALALTLAIAVLKGDRSEEVVEAVAQLGVARIVPFVSSRSVVRDLSDAKRARWEKIAGESAETARRGRIPSIEDIVAWDSLYLRLAPPVAVCWEREAIARGSAAEPLRHLEGRQASLVIGPEGGLSEDEVELFRARGARVVTLGPRSLRAETAAIAAVAVALL
jgi:16S rRNA (uracil1498-N3)-methyltransferase